MIRQGRYRSVAIVRLLLTLVACLLVACSLTIWLVLLRPEAIRPISDVRELTRPHHNDEIYTEEGLKQVRQADTYTISGTVLDKSRNPIEACVVGGSRNRREDTSVPIWFMRPLAKCSPNGQFEITDLTPSTYDFTFQVEEKANEKDIVPVILKSQTVTINNANVDLGEIVVSLEATMNRYRKLGLLSPPETINDDGVYVAFVSDHQAPTRAEDSLQFAYQAIYAVDRAAHCKGWDEMCDAAKRVSGVGKRSSPAWNRSGDTMAYLYRAKRYGDSQIVLRNVATGKKRVLKGVTASDKGISWDESGNRLAYVTSDNQICLYDLTTQSEISICRSEAESVALSPNAERVCFMRRDSIDVNNADLWFLNVCDIVTGQITQVGQANDNFGLIGPFYWAHDSSSIVFLGFVLDANENRKYAKYEYVLESGTMHKYAGDFSDIYDQRIRYWIRPK